MGAPGASCFARATPLHVIHVGMCQRDAHDCQLVRTGEGQQIEDLVAGIDEDRFACAFAAEHVAVLKNGPTVRTRIMNARISGRA